MFKKILIFITLFFLITSCKLELDGELFVADVIDVGDGKGSLNTPMNLSFEMSSEDTCNKDKEEISNILRGYFINFVAKDCYSKDFNSFLRVGADIPIILDAEKDGKVAISNESAINFSVMKSENEESYIYSTSIALNSQMYDSISNKIEDKYFQTLKLNKTKIELAINNDGRETEELRFAGSFVNGNPVVFPAFFKIARRQKIDFLGSNVTTGQFDQKKYAFIFQVWKSK